MEDFDGYVHKYAERMQFLSRGAEALARRLSGLSKSFLPTLLPLPFGGCGEARSG